MLCVGRGNSSHPVWNESSRPDLPDISRPDKDIWIDCMTVERRVRMMPSTAFLDSSHTASITPMETTNRQRTSALVGILFSMHTPNTATHTGTDARMTWFMESSMTVSDALLHAIWKPFMVAMATSPFQSF